MRIIHEDENKDLVSWGQFLTPDFYRMVRRIQAFRRIDEVIALDLFGLETYENIPRDGGVGAVATGDRPLP